MRLGEVQVPVVQGAIRVLGVWLDPALSWKEHITQAARKGLAAATALARLATSTWGPSLRNTRLLYTAVVRPTLLYGSQEWGMRGAGEALAKGKIKPLEDLQHDCLRRATGAYRRTARLLVQREAQVPPLDLYLEQTKAQRALAIRNHPVEIEISRAANTVWERMGQACGQRRGRRRLGARPPTSREALRAKAEGDVQTERDRQEALRHARAQGARRRRDAPEPTEKAILKGILTRAWRRRWEEETANRTGYRNATAWTTPWAQDLRKLYAGLSKAESTALFLMRSEVIGLNAWLTSIQVPGITAACECGWRAQTVRHALLNCPRLDRRNLLRACGTERLEEILSTPGCAQHAARWLIRCGLMEQFRVAAEIAEEDVSGYGPFQDAGEW